MSENFTPNPPVNEAVSPLPCPWCGGEPYHGASKAWGFVRCNRPSCEFQPEINRHDSNGVGGCARAIAAWNARAPAPSPAIGEVMTAADKAIARGDLKEAGHLARVEVKP